MDCALGGGAAVEGEGGGEDEDSAWAGDTFSAKNE